MKSTGEEKRKVEASEAEAVGEVEYDQQPEDWEPAPRRALRRHGIFAFFSLASIVLGSLFMYWLRSDLSYFFAPRTPLWLGDITKIDPSKIESNSYVYLEGIPNTETGIRFEKVLGDGFYRMFPLCGVKGVFVQLHVEEDGKNGNEKGGARAKGSIEIPGEFKGRALRFEDLESKSPLGSNYRNIRNFFFKKYLIEVPPHSLLIMDGETPSGYWMYPLIMVFLAVFVLVNGALLVRFFVLWRKGENC